MTKAGRNCPPSDDWICGRPDALILPTPNLYHAVLTPITNETQYQAALAEALRLGQENEEQHLERIVALGEILDAYEIQQGHEPALPTTLAGWLEVEMYRLRLRQKQFAQLLGVSESRLSEILNGRRAPNLDFVKRLHTTLRVPGDKLLALV